MRSTITHTTKLANRSQSAFNGVKLKDYRVTVHRTDAIKSSPEDCKINPIITLAKKKGFKPIQHDFYAANYCNSPTCERKVCATPCGATIKTEFLAHGTHSDSTKVAGTVLLSETDADNNARPQYGKFYPAKDRPSPSNANETLDHVRTKNINENNEMINNIAMYKKFND